MRPDSNVSEWIDISAPLRDGMVHWPGDPPVGIKRVSDINRGDSHTLSGMSMGSHTGTHIDAPLHFLKDGRGVDRMPLDTTVGRCRVLEIKDAQMVRPEDLRSAEMRPGERILLKTGNSSRAWQTDRFVEDFVYISDEAAAFLAACKIKMIGIDYLSVGPYRGGRSVHQTLLGAGVWIIEGLDLSAVSAGDYELVCLPLRIEQGDGAPARAIVRRCVPGG